MGKLLAIFSNLLKKIDVMGMPLNLTYNNNTTHRTLLGGLYTICLFVFSMFSWYILEKI